MDFSSRDLETSRFHYRKYIKHDRIRSQPFWKSQEFYWVYVSLHSLVKVEKANTILKYHRLRNIMQLFHFAELFFVLILFFWILLVFHSTSKSPVLPWGIPRSRKKPTLKSQYCFQVKVILTQLARRKLGSKDDDKGEVVMLSMRLTVGGSLPLKLPSSFPGSIGLNSNGFVYLDRIKLVFESEKEE
ncbi:hypothetical protein CK203_107376 [Vitis vinifera]|uniref:Uncharacterized protein n=1 Tax=Vitis vinifera TaxID=29760 RepID=A0A438ECL5_VITVI|nr:hypothetical protein CK203_107376 [Vitis vinifera]